MIFRQINEEGEVELQRLRLENEALKKRIDELLPPVPEGEAKDDENQEQVNLETKEVEKKK